MKDMRLSNGVAPTSALPNGVWERGEGNWLALIDVVEAVQGGLTSDKIENHNDNENHHQYLECTHSSRAHGNEEMDQIKEVGEDNKEKSQPPGSRIRTARRHDQLDKPKREKIEACDVSDEWKLRSQVDAKPPSESDFGRRRRPIALWGRKLRLVHGGFDLAPKCCKRNAVVAVDLRATGSVMIAGPKRDCEYQLAPRPAVAGYRALRAGGGELPRS